MTDIRKLAEDVISMEWHVPVDARTKLAQFALEALAVLEWYGELKEHNIWFPEVVNDKGQRARELLRKWGGE